MLDLPALLLVACTAEIFPFCLRRLLSLEVNPRSQAESPLVAFQSLTTMPKRPFKFS